METYADEKKNVALSSVLASLFLTAGKLVVGFMTGSLGMISEAAHSALDFFAAVITYFAVRVSEKPADTQHHYGHAKIENFSALIEVVLLLVTCVWIIKEAVNRLLYPHAPIEVNIWSFAVLLVSILVDFTRSRALQKVAKKTNSQALEADALHFSSDIFSSLMVLIGLIFTMFGIHYADSVAALAVAVIVIAASVRLAGRTIDDLLDKAPTGLDQLIARQVVEIPGVAGVHRLRLRQTGGKIQGDIHVVMDRSVSFIDGHKIATEVELKLAQHNADIVVHFEPEDDWEETEKNIKTTTTIIRRILDSKNSIIKEYHELDINYGHKGISVTVHIVLPRMASVSEANICCDEIKREVEKEVKDASLYFNIEPCEGVCAACDDRCPSR